MIYILYIYYKNLVNFYIIYKSYYIACNSNGTQIMLHVLYKIFNKKEQKGYIYNYCLAKQATYRTKYENSSFTTHENSDRFMITDWRWYRDSAFRYQRDARETLLLFTIKIRTIDPCIREHVKREQVKCINIAPSIFFLFHAQ